MLTPIEQMAESFHAAPDPELPEHVKAAADCEPYQPWAVAHMHIAHTVSTLYIFQLINFYKILPISKSDVSAT